MHRADSVAQRAAQIVIMLMASLSFAGAQTTSVATAGVDANPWTTQQWRIIQSLSLNRLPVLQPVPSNQYADDPQAAQLGKLLFFDATLSGSGTVSCASCHQPERYFTDGLARAGINEPRLGRNTPTIIGSAHQHWFYWDGRRDSMWSQALVPFEASNEMGSDRVSVLKQVAVSPDLANRYRTVFGRALDVSPQATPASPLGNATQQQNWFAMSARDRRQVNRTFANIGKAIAAYIRTLHPTPNRLDRYIAARRDGRHTAASRMMSPSERRGLATFIDDRKGQCLRCHSGPRLSNNGFHNIGSGTFAGSNLDFGRAVGVQAVLSNEFNCLGPYSDAKPAQCSALRFLKRDAHQTLAGAFKTPSLRNVAATAPYFHDGRYRNLREVVQHYVATPDQPQARNHELNQISLTELEITGLVDFLKMLAPSPSPAISALN